MSNEAKRAKGPFTLFINYEGRWLTYLSNSETRQAAENTGSFEVSRGAASAFSAVPNNQAAAAPDLLAALERIGSNGLTTDIMTRVEVQKLARAAIAKARGVA